MRNAPSDWFDGNAFIENKRLVSLIDAFPIFPQMARYSTGLRIQAASRCLFFSLQKTDTDLSLFKRIIEEFEDLLVDGLDDFVRFDPGPTFKGLSPLDLAIITGRQEVILYLFDSGAKVLSSKSFSNFFWPKFRYIFMALIPLEVTTVMVSLLAKPFCFKEPTP